MCGIAGFLCKGGNAYENKERALSMARAVHHRGPDSNGAWASDDGAVAFGHARLSVQDLSEHGAQPMQSASGRYVISYNGEVYNFPELMSELRRIGYVFRGHSDTEVMLAAIEAWGLEDAISRFVGMFAFAIWDKEERCLSLVRDRVGIKPLYYQVLQGRLVFGSEIKALLEADRERPSLDRGALGLFLRHNYVPAPHSIYAGISKVEPGCILSVRIDDKDELSRTEKPYWSLSAIATDATLNHVGSYGETLERFEELLSEAVRQRLVADVPLGAFLSGGIDSSTVVALMQQHSSAAVQTFSIGFSESDYDEAQAARKVADHLQTDHHELYVTPQDAQAVIPELPRVFDEPFSDSSQIPTILVSRLAREHVTVSLSGDGGDELLCGYKRYSLAFDMWKRIAWLPRPLRKVLAMSLNGIANISPDKFDEVLKPVFERYGRAGRTSDKLKKAASLLQPVDRESFYRSLVSSWKDPAEVVVGLRDDPDSLLGAPPPWMLDLGFRDYMMYADAATYLPDDILVKVDRASMACGLEARVPVLDHRVVEFCMRLPVEHKLHNGKTKAPLRDLLAKYIPADLIERPKMGFGVPIGSWLRGPLKEWASDLLSHDRIQSDGYLRYEPIARKWAEHLNSERDWSGDIWSVLMFQAWLDARG